MRSTLLVAFVLLSLPAARPCETAQGQPVGPLHFAPVCGLSAAAVAANDHGALGVWPSTRGQIFRITEDFGTLLDLAGHPFHSSQSSLGAGTTDGVPVLATDGTDFLLFQNTRGFASVQKISADGTVIGPILRVTSIGSVAGNTGGSGTVLWSGTEYTTLLTAAIADNETAGLYHGRIIRASVSRDGAVGGVDTLLDGASLAAAVSAGANRVLMIWHSGGVTEAGMLNGSALTRASQRLDAIPSTVSVALATDGVGFLAVWIEPGGRLAALRLDSSGAPSGPPIEIVTTPVVLGRSDPLAVWDGSSYVVFWSDDGATKGARISPNGTGPPAIVAAGRPAAATVTSRGTLLLTIHGCGTVASTVIDRGVLTAETSADVSIAVIPQRSPRVAATSRGHQLLWTEDGKLLTRFVGADGSSGEIRQLNDETVRSATGSFSDGSVSLIVPFHGGSYVAWSEGPENGSAVLRAQRLDAAGQPTGMKAAIDTLFFIFDIALAESGDELFIVTEEQRAFSPYPAPSSPPEVYAARLGGEGNLLQRAAVAVSKVAFQSVAASADGFQAIAGWMTDLHELRATTMDATNLRVQQATIISLPLEAGASRVVLRQGPPAAVFWIEGSSRLHMTLLDSRADVVVAEARDGLGLVRLEGDDLYWLVAPQATILSARLTPTAAGQPRARACFAIYPFPFAYAVRDGAPSALIYARRFVVDDRDGADDAQLRVQLLAPARRHAARR